MAIRWADSKASLQRIRSLGGVPLHACPQHLRPGGKVAIVQSDGKIALIFDFAHIDGPCAVTLANGKRREDGYVVRAKRGSIRSPRAGETTQLGIKWHAIGEIRYWDAPSGRSEYISDPTTSRGGDIFRNRTVCIRRSSTDLILAGFRAYRGTIQRHNSSLRMLPGWTASIDLDIATLRASVYLPTCLTAAAGV